MRAKLEKAKHVDDRPPIDRSALDAERSTGGRPRAGSLSTWAMLIKRILRHCHLWQGPICTLANARRPPSLSEEDPDEPRELQLVLDPEFL